MNGALQPIADGFRIVGGLDFESAPALYRATGELLSRSPVRLELDGVDRAGSAGLALLLEWRREARRRGVELRLSHVPDAVMRLARLSGVEDLLDESPNLSARVADPV